MTVTRELDILVYLFIGLRVSMLEELFQYFFSNCIYSYFEN